MKNENQGTSNRTDCQSDNSDTLELRASSREDAPENRQDLRVVAMTELLWLELINALHLAKYRLGLKALGHLEFDAIITALRKRQPAPDQGEHVAQEQDGDSWCDACQCRKKHCGGGYQW